MKPPAGLMGTIVPKKMHLKTSKTLRKKAAPNTHTHRQTHTRGTLEENKHNKQIKVGGQFFSVDVAADRRGGRLIHDLLTDA